MADSPAVVVSAYIEDLQQRYIFHDANLFSIYTTQYLEDSSADRQKLFSDIAAHQKAIAKLDDHLMQVREKLLYILIIQPSPFSWLHNIVTVVWSLLFLRNLVYTSAGIFN